MDYPTTTKQIDMLHKFIFTKIHHINQRLDKSDNELDFIVQKLEAIEKKIDLIADGMGVCK